MSDDNTAADVGDEGDDQPPMEAAHYPDGTILYPPHPLGPNGDEPIETVDLSKYRATVVTWTSSTATPPGVREPNHLAIVEFSVDGEAARAIGQLTTDDVEIGDTVEPVYDPALRAPDAGIRELDSQSWDGYRFQPVE